MRRFGFLQIFKLVAGLLVVGLIALFFYQNGPAFQTDIPFMYDLKIQEPMEWTHRLSTLLLFAAGGGFFIGVLLMLKPYFNVRRLLAQERQEKQAVAAAQPAPLTETPAAPGEKEEPAQES